MLENIFGRFNLPFLKSPELKQAQNMVLNGSVGNMVNSYNNDSVSLINPRALGAVPVNSGFANVKSPAQQVTDLGNKYNIPFNGGDFDAYQKRVVKAVIMHKAMKLGVPMNVALGIAGNESGWKMWTNINNGALVEGKNIRGGVLKSTDWGAMQINDKAHPNAFPRAKYDLEYNIDYGLNFLAKRAGKISGDMGLGFGDWDRTIASYNLGHNPADADDYAIARNYVSRVKSRSLKV